MQEDENTVFSERFLNTLCTRGQTQSENKPTKIIIIIIQGLTFCELSSVTSRRHVRKNNDPVHDVMCEEGTSSFR
jgi:hypothetical protein